MQFTHQPNSEVTQLLAHYAVDALTDRTQQIAEHVLTQAISQAAAWHWSQVGMLQQVIENIKYFANPMTWCDLLTLKEFHR